MPVIARTGPIDFFKVQDTPNQLLWSPKGVLSINSGYGGETIAGISLIGESDKVRNFLLEPGTNPYRGAIRGDFLYLSLNATDELLEINLNEFHKETSTKLKTRVLHQPDSHTTGGESVIILNEDLIWSFSNILPDSSYLEGVFLRFSLKNLNQPPQRIVLSDKNPKTLTKSNDRGIVYVTGEYGKSNGKLFQLNFEDIPTSPEVLNQENLEKAGLLKKMILRGTPGPLRFDDKGFLWSCDLESSTLYRIDLKNWKIELFEMPFAACSDIEIYKDKIFISHLYGGVNNRPQEHLFIMSLDHQKELCRIELKKDSEKPSSPHFVSDLLLSKKHLYLALSGSAQIARLELNSEGLPFLCP